VSINNRWFQLCASLVAMIMIANLQYAWTLFVEPMQKGTGWQRSDIQAAFALFIVLLWALGKYIELPPQLHIASLLPEWHGVILALVCLLQFASSLIIDRRYETQIGRNYFWVIWYPMAYWLISLSTTLVALPKTLLRRRSKRATWTSPDRGIR